MKELIVKIKHTNPITNLNAADVKAAMEYLFGINAEFEVEEISSREVTLSEVDSCQ